MGNKEWENYLREILGDFKTEGDAPSWDDFTSHGDPVPDPTDLPESLQDEALRENLINYSPDSRIKGWERIEASLDAADREFDDQLRRKINQYQPAQDPHSWPAFMTRFSAHKLLRARLIALKVFETAAMLLIVVTLLHLGQRGKIPFYNPASPDQLSPVAETLSKSTDPLDQQSLTNAQAPVAKALAGATSYNSIHHPSAPASNAIPHVLRTTPAIPGLQSPVLRDNVAMGSDVPVTSIPSQVEMENAEVTGGHSLAMEAETKATIPAREVNIMSQSPSLPVTTIGIKNIHVIPDPVFVSAMKTSFLEFGMLIQADYNQLKMPEDRVNNDGKQVVFPLQGITSPGYGAGFTLALSHTRWALETGLIYSSKSFRPGRELTVGAGLDNSNVEYEAMRMQLVSAPLQLRYRIEPKGRLKTYALAGFGLHVIAQSDIDVMVEYNFPSLTEGEDPNNVPSLARTIRQTQRISEDIRKKAPFSTQSFISANLGIGIEYLLDEHKTLFLQTAYQYQIPNLRFSNHDGKHLLTLSFQAGVRTPLGN